VTREVNGVCEVWNGFHLLVYGKMLKRRRAIHHLVEDAAQRPDVARSTNFETSHAVRQLNCLWTHVVHGADLELFVREAYCEGRSSCILTW
jgi:hypothetical protein